MTYQYDDVLIIQFAKAPVPGKVKTRLIPALGEQRACQLHCALTKKVLHELQRDALAPLLLYTDDASATQLQALACGAPVYQQQGIDLGKRMAHAFNRHLPDKRVILVGSDCPAIDSAYLTGAIAKLDKADIVLGPADDGGYVLIAMSAPQAGIFESIEWGSSHVLRQTLAAIERHHLSVCLLEALPDIDRPEDLLLLNRYGIELPV